MHACIHTYIRTYIHVVVLCAVRSGPHMVSPQIHGSRASGGCAEGLVSERVETGGGGLNWVSYHSKETILCTIDPYCSNFNRIP